MTEPTPEFVELIASLAVVYSRELDEPMLEGYWMTLQNIPIERLKESARRAMREVRYMPVPATLRDYASDVRRETVQTRDQRLIAEAKVGAQCTPAQDREFRERLRARFPSATFPPLEGDS